MAAPIPQGEPPQAPHTGGRPPWGVPRNFQDHPWNFWATRVSGRPLQHSIPCPVFPDISALTGASSVSWLLLQLMGCTPQAYKACTSPASRPKKEPGVSDRDINGLTDGGAYLSGARSWSDTPPCAANSEQDGSGLRSRVGREIASYRGTASRCAHWLPGKPAEGTPLTAPLIRTIPSWGLGRVCKKVSQVGGV